MTWKRSGTCCARGRYWSMRPCKGGPVGCHYLHAPSPGGALIPEETGQPGSIANVWLASPSATTVTYLWSRRREVSSTGNTRHARPRRRAPSRSAAAFTKPMMTLQLTPALSASPQTRHALPHARRRTSRAQTAAAPKSAPSPVPGSGAPAPAGNPLSS